MSVHCSLFLLVSIFINIDTSVIIQFKRFWLFKTYQHIRTINTPVSLSINTNNLSSRKSVQQSDIRVFDNSTESHNFTLNSLENEVSYEKILLHIFRSFLRKQHPRALSRPFPTAFCAQHAKVYTSCVPGNHTDDKVVLVSSNWSSSPRVRSGLTDRIPAVSTSNVVSPPLLICRRRCSID